MTDGVWNDHSKDHNGIEKLPSPTKLPQHCSATHVCGAPGVKLPVSHYHSQK